MLHAITSTSGSAIRASDVLVPNMLQKLICRRMDCTNQKFCPETGIVAVRIVVHTTMPAEQAAIDVVHPKIIVVMGQH